MTEHVIQSGVRVATSETILLVGEAEPSTGSLRAQIESLGYALKTFAAPDDAVRLVEDDPPALVIIDASAPDVDAYRLAIRIKELTEDRVVPVMFACLAQDLRAEIESRDLGADDCFARPIDTDALAARIRLLLRNAALERSLRRKHNETLALNCEITHAQEIIGRELELAARIQRSLLPTEMPALDRFQFAASLRASGVVSGDFYDIYRLDETHWGFYIADAIGHGVPAALLTILVKKGIQTRDVTSDGYRLLSPGEVLTRLNRDLIAEKLSTNPFVTLFYGILDVEAATLTYASGGHPPAVLLSAGGATVPLMSEGALLGIFESDFTTGVHVLSPGDVVVLYTDGVELAEGASGRDGLDALIDYLAPKAEQDANDDASRDAFDRHVELVFDALIPPDLPRERNDDVTVLTLRMLA